MRVIGENMDGQGIVKVWLANLSAIVLNVALYAKDTLHIMQGDIMWLQAVKEVLGIMALILSMCYTLWQWHKAHKRKGGK